MRAAPRQHPRLTAAPRDGAAAQAPPQSAPDRVARRVWPRTGVAAALIAAQVSVLAVVFHAAPQGVFWWYAAAWVLFGGAVWAVRGVPGRPAGRLVLAGGLAVIATGLLGPPATSTDSFRYAWDGRVQSAGLSPYDRTPADPALAHLRDPWLFPDCAQGRFYPIDGACTRINRPTVHTIYPPLAEAYFLLVDRLSPEGARHKPLQVSGALLAAGTTAALLIMLRRRDVRAAAYWAWCPAVPMEAVNNAHVDMLAVAAVVLAFGAARAGPLGRGALLGAAVAVKLVPAVVIPGALAGTAAGAWRAALRTLVPAVLVVVLAYLPYVLASQGSVFGYLSGYLAEEGYDEAGARDRYALLRWVLPDSWALPAALAILAAVLLHVLRRGDPDRPWRGALVLTGTAFLVLTPGFPWYALLIVALVALDGRWEWLGVPVAGAVAYLTSAGTPAYAAAAALVAGAWVVRQHRMSS
ncbi:glycosyltransferase 87 family protein [Nonomuraea turcica]|uniref:glycosyltransferase 87 family protein n=1 Tax=Nonomuraea sp. G32 TaxID=3067274 RepID=UPI00273C030B|nr:glycosyltransferase 87 family protein [Nonomuraea sp. G32]MDP4505196.1 glycosyltransferase 87 family protein [Nonomuraea sp. G32]